jgi:hypothetical protein
MHHLATDPAGAAGDLMPLASAASLAASAAGAEKPVLALDFAPVEMLEPRSVMPA